MAKFIFFDTECNGLPQNYRATFDGAHDALADIEATKKCYFALKQRGIV